MTFVNKQNLFSTGLYYFLVLSKLAYFWNCDEI